MWVGGQPHATAALPPTWKDSVTVVHRMGRYRAVSIATRYELDGPEIESQAGKIFCNHPDRPSLLYHGHRGFPGGKAVGTWRWPPTQCGVEVKERIEVYQVEASSSEAVDSIPSVDIPINRCVRRYVQYNYNTLITALRIIMPNSGIILK
jgi:hypothetical protein